MLHAVSPHQSKALISRENCSMTYTHNGHTHTLTHANGWDGGPFCHFLYHAPGGGEGGGVVSPPFNSSVLYGNVRRSEQRALFHPLRPFIKRSARPTMHCTVSTGPIRMDVAAFGAHRPILIKMPPHMRICALFTVNGMRGMYTFCLERRVERAEKAIVKQCFMPFKGFCIWQTLYSQRITVYLTYTLCKYVFPNLNKTFKPPIQSKVILNHYVQCKQHCVSNCLKENMLFQLSLPLTTEQ